MSFISGKRKSHINKFMGEKIAGANDFAYFFHEKTFGPEGPTKNEKMPSSRYRYEDLISKSILQDGLRPLSLRASGKERKKKERKRERESKRESESIREKERVRERKGEQERARKSRERYIYIYRYVFRERNSL